MIPPSVPTVTAHISATLKIRFDAFAPLGHHLAAIFAFEAKSSRRRKSQQQIKKQATVERRTFFVPENGSQIKLDFQVAD